MKKYYSHYTFIYPDICLKNCIVELNNQSFISAFYTFEKEIANTIFHSGLLIFFPQNIEPDRDLLLSFKNRNLFQSEIAQSVVPKDTPYQVYDENGIMLNS